MAKEGTGQRGERSSSREVEAAKAICDRIRLGDRAAVKKAKKIFQSRPSDEVRAMLIEALAQMPTSTPQRPPERPRDSNRRYVPLEHPTTILIATLRRDGSSWSLEIEDGRFHRISTIAEANPSAYADRKLRWRITVDSSNRVTAVTEKNVGKGGDINAWLGGLPGQGKNRRN